jgi:hypothetical protein
MYKNVLASIPGIEWYPIVALVFFFSFFIGLVVWFVKADKTKLRKHSELVLEDGMEVGNG